MVVRLRFHRLGCRNRPFYRVVAADSRSPRDGKQLEVLGHYDPLPGQDGGKRMALKFDRIKAGVLPPPPMSAVAHKGGPRNSRPVDPLAGCFVTLAEHTSTDLPKSSKNAELNSKSLNIATLFDK